MNVSGSCLTHTFVESFVLTRENARSSWMPRPRTNPVDRQLDEWCKNRPLVVKAIHPSTQFHTSDDGLALVCTLVYAVVYELRAGFRKDVMPRPGKLPLWARRTPCVEAVDENTGQSILVMAGMFGVPEGAPFGREDSEPAPSPLLSPDFALIQYGELFKPHEPGTDEYDSDPADPEGDAPAVTAGGGEKIPLPPGA
jgi:hypothetical protein